jgi:hypothetical protein
LFSSSPSLDLSAAPPPPPPQGKIVTEEELRDIVEQYDLDGSGTFDEVL